MKYLNTMDKYKDMKAFIEELHCAKGPSKSSARNTQEILGAISWSQDLSMFDPGSSSVVTHFYVNLYEFINSLEPQSNVVWNTIDVLLNACKNVSAKQALIHTYKFASILVKFLQIQLVIEKKRQILKVLQELTHGIKILWHEAYLSSLISTLTQWITQSKEIEIAALSLGVLANLCHNNFPAIYTLFDAIDVEKFIKLPLFKIIHGNIAVQFFKLVVILQSTNANISENNIKGSIALIFLNLRIGINHDNVLLRQVVTAFNDIAQDEHSRDILLMYPDYEKDIKLVLVQFYEEETNEENIALVMEFLLSLVKLKLPVLTTCYLGLVESVMKWVSVKQVSSKALALIRNSITSDTQCASVLTETNLSYLMVIMNSKDEDNSNKLETAEMTETIQTEWIQLFEEIIKIPLLKQKIVQLFNGEQEMMKRLFSRLLNTNNEFLAEDWIRIFVQNNASSKLYIYALALMAELAVSCNSWLTLYSELLEKERIQMVMALALLTGDTEVKQKVLQLTSSNGFSQKCISTMAIYMKKFEPLVLVPLSANDIILKVANETLKSTELASLFFMKKKHYYTLPNLLPELNPIDDVSMFTNKYESAAMKISEIVMKSALETANNYSTSLQHKLTQEIAESCKLHQLLFDIQHSLEVVEARKFSLAQKLRKVEGEINKTNDKQVIDSLNEMVIEKLAEIDTLATKIQELEEECIIANKTVCDMSKDNQELKIKILQSMMEAYIKE